MTGSGGDFRHYVIPAMAKKGDKIWIESKGFLGFLKGEVKFLVVKESGITNIGQGDIRWEGESFKLDREVHKKFGLLNKDFRLILKDDNSVEVEFKDSQQKLVKQKLNPDGDKVYHKQAMAYTAARRAALTGALTAAGAAAKLGAAL